MVLRILAKQTNKNSNKVNSLCLILVLCRQLTRVHGLFSLQTIKDVPGYLLGWLSVPCAWRDKVSPQTVPVATQQVSGPHLGHKTHMEFSHAFFLHSSHNLSKRQPTYLKTVAMSRRLPLLDLCSGHCYWKLIQHLADFSTDSFTSGYQDTCFNLLLLLPGSTITDIYGWTHMPFKFYLINNIEDVVG